ncbi:MAG: RHS repeat protein, partial [Nitrospinae bacterium]|nr:RHS repeat protein [Nitrospinota bacterium]
ALSNVTTYTYGGGSCPSCGGSGGDSLTSITDAKGQVTTYEYNTLGRLIKETDPLGNSITYSYDAKGNLTSGTDANGNTINYTYDVLSRLTKKLYPDGTTENFTYDLKGNILIASNQHISYTFTYDSAGKATSVTDSYGRVIKYEYDVSGNRTNMTVSDSVTQGFSLAYTYDSTNRLTSIISPLPAGERAGVKGSNSPLTKGDRGLSSGEAIFSFTYDTAGRRTKLTYPNGVTTTYSYDKFSRLTNLLTQNPFPAGFKQGSRLQTLDSYTYTHDKVGDRLSEVTHGFSHDIIKRDYFYDAIYRLLQSTPVKIQNDKEKEFEHKLAPEGLNQGAEVFTYDGVGNRLTGPKEKLNYTYNEGNQLMSFLRKLESREGEATLKNKVTYTYDKNGNLTKKLEYDDDGNIKKSTLYSYDYENQLVKVEIQKGDRLKVVSFTYDPFGRRLSKSVHREEIDDDDNEDNDKDEDDKVIPRTTYYVYDNEDIIMEYNHKGKVTARYVHGLRIDEPLAIEQKGKVYYYHADGLGSVTTFTDSRGKVVQRYDHDSFGKLKKHGNKVKNAYTYTAREYDRETGLYYYRARYYDAKVGRFISKDPFPGLMSLPQTLNHYSYVGNNPVIWIDPWGLYWEYSQSTGQMTYVDNQSGATTPVGTGYSGQGAGYNNPNMQNVPNIGPIPQGAYTIGPQWNHPRKGPGVMNLTPNQDTNTFGRTNFLIHGDDPCRCQSASKGCIILSPNIRNQIAGSEDNELRIVQ